ncbi:Bifunctional riboflavin biosynthesis protein RIBA 1, chloroplastic [Chlamydiales bacterium SCGC AG-110-P3]|nr:Bifunctional riboflavin biosynthesis protein RIBA 1, chloroplastic [Chlamydiales bacterium SCGC AG-110-P3]
MRDNSVEEAIAAIQKGGFAIVIDDKDRENEGDLIMAAEMATPETVAFMVRHTTGIICVSLKEERLKALNLPQMVENNTESHRTAFTVSVDYKVGTTTGVSACDRAATIRALADNTSTAEDFARPGHLFPLRYAHGGVLKRAGHTEAAVDLVTMADLQPAGVISEIVKDDGSMAREGELRSFAEKHGIPVTTIADIVRYRRSREKLVRSVTTARIPTAYGDFTAHVYESILDGIQHVALVKGELTGKERVLVRVHSECLTGDIFGSLRCDCGQQLHAALAEIGRAGEGLLVYLRGHEGRGIGLAHKMRAYNLQDQGRDTVQANEDLGFPADSREYGIGAQILADLGVTTIRLMTNNPAKYGGLSGFDLEIVERVPLVCEPNTENADYLRTKQEKLGHLFNIKTEETLHA